MSLNEEGWIDVDHSRVAHQITEHVGGAANIAHAEHCMTRLRLNLVAPAKADKKAIEAMPEVLGVVDKGGQLQVILGGEVPQVFQAMGVVGSSAPAAGAGAAKGGLGARMLDALSGVFVPILPAIIGAGMLKGLLSTLVVLEWVNAESTTYGLLNAVSDGAFYFLPILIAFSGAKKFGMNVYVAAAIAMAALHPTVTTLLSTAKTEGTDVAFFGLPVTPATYSASVLGMFVTVWLAAKVERFFNKYIHSSVRVIFAPMLTILVMITAFFVVIGPAGAILGNYLATGVTWLFENTGPLAGIAMGAGWPLLVIVGMHYATVPLFLESLATNGYDYILVCATMANIAQGAAALGVYFRLRNKAQRTLAISSGITAIFGVTESAIYGINLRYRRPFIAGLIGSGIGSGFALIMGAKAYVFVKTGIQGIPMFIGPTFVWAIVAMVISVGVAFAVAYFWGVKDELQVAVEGESGDSTAVALASSGASADTVVAPVDGTLVALSDVKDEAFSAGILGQGVAIEPSSGRFVSPVNGTVRSVFPTGHAVGIVSDTGTEILIHVGLDTVKLDGAHFTALVAAGDDVEVGTPLIDADLAAITAAGYSALTPVVVTSPGEVVVARSSGTVSTGQALFAVRAAVRA